MNTEEKARAYDEVRKKLALRFGSNVAEEIFSEFEMSEDEKVRKELIKVFSNREKYLIDQSFGDITVSEVLAWLEKQKEYESTDFEYVWDRTDCGDLTSALDKYSEEAIINMCHAWYDKGIELERKYWIKKQGKTFTKKDIDDAYLKGICNTKHELEKQGEQKDNLSAQEAMDIAVAKCFDKDEQKPADKIEPKFHEGDWITNGDYTWKVIKVEQFDYILQSQNGNVVDDTISHVDEQFHLWTISDAKDGDVLYLQKDGKEHIIIYKGVIKERFRTFVSAYCAYNGIVDAFCFSDVSRYVDIAYGGIMPVTKSQRDTLFAKMKEAGYEWSEETHELKKISQRMVSAEAKEALYDKPTDEEMKELLRTEYEKGRADTIAEMKSSWSEEDEKNRNLINTILWESVGKHLDAPEYDSTVTQGDAANLTQWLKSIKDRVQPQPDIVEALRTEYEKGRADTIAKMKSSWSEEDENVLKDIKTAVTSYWYEDVEDAILDWLKSLKDRYTWKPSKGQLECLGYAIDNAEKDYSPLANNRIYLTLKALKEELEKLTK